VRSEGYYYLIFNLYMAGDNNIKAQMRKGILEYLVMLCLKEHPAYSSDLINTLKKGEFVVVEGALYPLLMRLKQNELLDYTWVESTLGPPRKYYSLTAKGYEFLNELEMAYDEIEKAVKYIKNNPMKECSLDNNKIIAK
jgi:PadR family transcriptional regulator PadR